MSKDENKKEKKSDPEEIHIDYENIDVQDIMDQIKRKIASQVGDSELKSEQAGALQPLSSTEGNESEDVLPPPSRGKRVLLKLARPFAPLIKFLILPVYQELRDTVEILDRSNKRLDQLEQTLGKTNTHSLNTSQRLDQELPFLKEYTRLLFNLAHNTVVEMTKLKIEEENIKLRIRILEKDFENLKSRERALEARVLS